MKKLVLASLAALLIGAVSVSKATPPFVATATTTDASPISVTASGSNFFDFIDTLVKTQSQFATLNGHPYNSNMTFLGVPNAIRHVVNAPGTSNTITLTPIGFSRTFTGVDKQAVDDSIKDFFKKDGGQVLADFLNAIARTSPIAVTDGNPNAATAIAAGGMFSGMGFTGADELVDGADTSTTAVKPKFGGISLGLNAGRFEAGDFKGSVYDLSATVLNFGSDQVRFLVPVAVNYLTLDGGSKVFGAGINAALPIRLSKMGKDSSYNWRVTPVAGISIRGSLDLASLSPLWTLGVINTVDYRATDKLVVSMVNQITMHKSITIAYGELNFDPKIDQQILKNGIRLTTPYSRRVICDGFIVDTQFMKSAAVRNFWTLGGSVAFRVTQTWNLVFGVNYDTGTRFKAYSGGLSSAWKW